MVKRADPAEPVAPAPAVIQPNGVYTLAQATRLLGLKKTCLPREVRLGRLRVSKRGGRYMVLGQWLLDWVVGGELRRQPARPSAVAD